MDVPGSTNRLLRIVLSWDYFELSQVVEKGTARNLNPVPDTFDSVEVYLITLTLRYGTVCTVALQVHLRAIGSGRVLQWDCARQR